MRLTMSSPRRVVVVVVVCCVLVVFISQAYGSPARLDFGGRSRRHRRADDNAEPNCMKCQPGTFAIKPCFYQTSTVCEPCPDKTFTSLPNVDLHCQPCSTCLEGFFQIEACTSKSDTVCQACTPATCPERNSNGADMMDMMDMMLGDDHSTYTDDIKATAASPDVKDHAKDPGPVPEHKDNDAGAKPAEEEEIGAKHNVNDVKVAPSEDDVDVLLDSMAAEHGEGSGDEENLVSEILEETTAKESVLQPTQPTPPAVAPPVDKDDNVTPPSQEMGSDSEDDGAEEDEHHDEGSDVTAALKDKTTLATLPEKQSAELDAENLVSVEVEEKDDLHTDHTTVPPFSEADSENAEGEGAIADDTLPSPPSVVGNGVSEDHHKDEAESEPSAHTEEDDDEKQKESSTQPTHQPGEDEDENVDDSDLPVQPVEEDHDDNQDNEEAPAPQPEEESEDSAEKNSDGPVLSVAHSVLENPPSKQNTTDVNPVVADGNAEEDEHDDVGDKDAVDDEVIDKDLLPEAGEKQANQTDYEILTPEEDDNADVDDEGDEEDVITSDFIPASPATSPQPDPDVDNEDDDDSSKETDPVDHIDPHTPTSTPEPSDKETESEGHVPILIHHSEEEDNDEEEDKDVEEEERAHGIENTTHTELGTTPLPEEPKNDTESAVEVLPVLIPDADNDEDEETETQSPEPVTVSPDDKDDEEEEEEKMVEKEEEEETEEDEVGEKEEEEEDEATTVIPDEGLIPDEADTSSEDVDQVITTPPGEPSEDITTTPSGPQEPTIPQPAVTEDDNQTVSVELGPKEEASSPSPASSTTQRIPTLEEVEDADLGSGDVPGVLSAGGKEKEEVTGVVEVVVDHNVTEEAEGDGEEGVDVVTGDGKEEEEATRTTPGRPEEESEGVTGVVEVVVDHNVTEEAEGDGEEEVDVDTGDGEEEEEATGTTPGRPEDGTRRGEEVPVVSEESEESVESEEEEHHSHPEEGEEIEEEEIIEEEEGEEIEEEEIIEEELEIEPAKQGGDTEEDEEGKRRTAIIVGVAVAGVAVFALGFFLSRYCRKRGAFKVMKKVPQDNGTTNGNDDSIEFRPVRSGSGIYDEVDEVAHPPVQGSYKRVPEGGYTPVATTITPTHVSTFTTAPNGDTYAVVNKKKPPPSRDEDFHEPMLNGIDRIRYIDETTDDEGAEPTPHDRLLPPRHYHAALPEVEEDENRYKPPEPETRPPASSFSDGSQTSLSEAVLRNVEGQVINGNGGNGYGMEDEEEEEKDWKTHDGKELTTKGMGNGSVEVAVTVENGHA